MESPDEGKRLSPLSSSPASSDFLEAETIESPENTALQIKHNQDNAIGTLEKTSPVAETRDGRSSNDVRTSPAGPPGGVAIAGKGSGPSSSLPENPSQSNASKNCNDLRTDPATTLADQANVSTPKEKSNLSASDCSEVTGANGNSIAQASANGPTKVVDSPVTSGFPDEDLLTGTMPKSEQHCQVPAVDAQNGELNLGNDSAETEFPPTQMMERPGDPSSSPYRIPDYVFARNKSTAPLEWSTASNESLFSIQMGNTSFTRDQFAWLSKSGELGLPGEVNYLPISPCNIDFNSNQPPSKQIAAEVPQKSGNVVEQPSPRKTEAKAAEIMREVIRENSENRDKANSPSVPGGNYHSACLSHASDGSTRSFAFPILSGEGDISSSRRGDLTKQKHQYSSPKPHPQRESRPQTPNETPNASQPPKSTSNVPKCSWGLSCFSCCPSCCS